MTKKEKNHIGQRRKFICLAAVILLGLGGIKTVNGFCDEVLIVEEEPTDEEHAETEEKKDSDQQAEPLVLNEIEEDEPEEIWIEQGTEGTAKEEQTENVIEISLDEILIEDPQLETEGEDGESAERIVDETEEEGQEEIEGTVLAAAEASDAETGTERYVNGYSYENAYGDQLSGESKKIYEAMKKAWIDERGTASISYTFSSPRTFWVNGSITVSETGAKTAVYDKDSGNLPQTLKQITTCLQAAYDAFAYDYPEAFWLKKIKPGYNFRFSSTGDGTLQGNITLLTIIGEERYSGAKADNAAFYSAVASMTAKIKSKIEDTSQQIQVLKAIHDAICEEVSYGYGEMISETDASGNTVKTSKYAHTAAGLFMKDKKVVCEGYAKSFKILCRQFNIPCAIVVGSAVNKSGSWELHMWNYVKLQKKWYLIDVTWDDSGKTIDYTYFLAGSSTKGYHDIISKERILNNNFSGNTLGITFQIPLLNAQQHGSYPVGAHQHIFGPYLSNGDATCQSYGTKTAVCELCQETTTIADTVLAEHKFEDYVFNKDATCQKDGTETAKCSYGCGKTDTRTAAGTKLKNHVYGGKWIISKEATCVKEGEKYQLCTMCGQKGNVKTIKKLSPTIKLSTTKLTMKAGWNGSMTVSVSKLGKGDKVVSWKAQNSSLVSVSASGSLKKATIKPKKKTGTTKVTVTLASGLKKDITVKIQKSDIKTTKLTVPYKSVNMKLGSKITIKAERSPVNATQAITYTTSDKKIASVSSKGVIKAVGAGSANITVKSGSKKVTISVRVLKTPVSKITGVSGKLTLKVGKKTTIKAKAEPNGCGYKVTYSSSNSKIATVSKEGVVKGIKKGTAVILVKAGNKSIKCKVTVK